MIACVCFRPSLSRYPGFVATCQFCHWASSRAVERNASRRSGAFSGSLRYARYQHSGHSPAGTVDPASNRSPNPGIPVRWIVKSFSVPRQSQVPHLQGLLSFCSVFIKRVSPVSTRPESGSQLPESAPSGCGKRFRDYSFHEVPGVGRQPNKKHARLRIPGYKVPGPSLFGA